MEHIFKEHSARNTESLNGDWEFCVDFNNKGEEQKWYEKFPKNSRNINVPACWNFENDLFAYFGTAWYKKEFYTEECFLLLEFGAVSGLCKVYLDGEYLGQHYGGWTAFDFFKNVAKGKHTLVLMVDASSNDVNTIPLQKVDWYHYGGIIRSVQFTQFNKPFIYKHKISYNLDSELKNAAVNFKIALENLTEIYESNINIYLNDKVIYNGLLRVCNNTEVEISGINLQNIELWDVGKPKLYKVKIEIDGDDVTEQIGFRKIEVKGDKIYLNGNQVFFKGVNRHEEHPDWGFAMPANLQKRDVDIIKDLNCNVVRGSHYPNSHTFLDYLDREGIMFWSEIPMWQFDPKAMSDSLTIERGLTMHREMIEQYYHHPCIVLWGLHNENLNQTKECYELTKTFSEFVRSADDSRLVTYATARYDEDICLEFVDVISLNYYFGWYSGTLNDWDLFFKNIPKNAQKHNVAGKPVVISEFGCAAIYGNSNLTSDKWTMQFQAETIEKVITLALKDEKISGTFVWQYADIKSDIDINRARSFNNKGILDEYRRPKFAYYTVKRLYA